MVDACRSVGVRDLTDGWTPLRRLRLAQAGSASARSLARPVWVIPREVFDARLVERRRPAGAVLRRHRVRDVRAGSHRGGPRRPVPRVGSWSARTARTRCCARPPAALPDAGPWRSAATPRRRRPGPAPRSSCTASAASRRTPGPSTAVTGWPTSGTASCSTAATGPTVAGGAARAARDAAAGLRRRGHGSGAATTCRCRGGAGTQPDGPVLLAGDAAGLVNPMTGEGIYYAVATGHPRRPRGGPAPCWPARRPAPGRRTARRAARCWPGTCGTPRWPPGSPPCLRWSTPASAPPPADQQVFDDLVEIGLGQGTITPRLAGGAAGRPRRTPVAHPDPLVTP